MTQSILSGKNIAILVANGFEERDFTEAQRAFAATAAQVAVISPENGLVNGWHDGAWGHYFPIDKGLGEVLAADYTALVVPGGERSIQKLANNAHARRIVTGFIDAEKPTLLMGAAVSLLASFERAAGRKVSAPNAQAEALTAAGTQIDDGDTALSSSLLTTRVEDADAVRAVLGQAITLIDETGQVADAA